MVEHSWVKDILKLVDVTFVNDHARLVSGKFRIPSFVWVKRVIHVGFIEGRYAERQR